MFIPAFIPGLGIPELLIILAVVLIIFGPRKLPELGKAIGQTMRELRKSSSGDGSKDTDKDKDKVEASSETAEDSKKEEASST